jgi:hypothetical protein
MVSDSASPIEVADMMISRVQSLCMTLRHEGFRQQANDLEDDIIRLYDKLLPHLASRDYLNPQVLEIAEAMLKSLSRVGEITELVDFRDRIMKAFKRES